MFDYLILLPNNEELFQNLGFDHADINIYKRGNIPFQNFTIFPVYQSEEFFINV